MAKAHLSLDRTEVAVFQSAAAIYAAYVQRGLTHAEPNKNQDLHERAVVEAIALARLTDDLVQSEEEFS